jgi:putative transposase
MMVSFKGAYFP